MEKKSRKMANQKLKPSHHPSSIISIVPEKKLMILQVKKEDFKGEIIEALDGQLITNKLSIYPKGRKWIL